MLEKEKKLNLADLIDVKFLQEFQDIFANTMNIAALTLDENSYITSPSNFSDFCNNYIRKNPEGFKRCQECDLKWGQIAAQRGEPVIYTCHAGLTDFAVPIIIDGNHIGSIYGGQVLLAPQDEIKAREYAKELRFDENGYIEALKKIRILSAEKIQTAAHFLFFVANAISEIGHKNLKLIKQNNREKFNKDIIGILGSSLDKKNIVSLFVKNIGEFFEADRVVFSNYNTKNNTFFPTEENEEYLANIGEKSFVKYDWSNNEAKEFIQPLLEQKELNIFCLDEYLLEHKPSQNFISLFKYANIKSTYNMPVTYQNKLLGFFCIDFTHKVTRLSYEDLEIVKSICNQAAIALYNADLYIKAQEANRAKGSFIANISHEIKTPLNIIIGFSELMSETQIDRHKQIEYLKNINKSGKHLLSLTNDIINLSKTSSEELNYENINSSEIIKEVTDSIKLLAQDKNICINTEGIIQAEIEVDKKMFIQVLYNLLVNAIKFTPKSGNVTVKSQLDKNKLIISIEDTGIGIPNEYMHKIFEEFKQIDSSYARQQEGIGLGLAISKKLVELHKGSIYAEANRDKGSKFYISLPISPYVKRD